MCGKINSTSTVPASPCTFPFGTNEDPLPNTYIIQIVEKGMREREKEKNQYQ